MFLLKNIINILDAMKGQEVRYFDVPRRCGKSTAVAALSRYNYAVLNAFERQRDVTISNGGDPDNIFTKIRDMRDLNFNGIIIEEGFYRSNLEDDIKELKAFNCPILVIGTSEFTEKLFLNFMEKIRG